MYSLGASPHSSFNLNRIRLACLVGCLEEYDNRLRAQTNVFNANKDVFDDDDDAIVNKTTKF